jgi:hypothetical protein
MFGFLLTTASIGALTTTLARLQELARQRSKQFATLNRFLAENSISSTLTARILRNAHYAFDEQKMQIQESQVELLVLVSEQLRVELHYEMHSLLVRTHPFMQLFDLVHSRAIQNICSNAVSIQRITRGDVLFTSMEVPNRPGMYICKSGSFRYLSMEKGAENVSEGVVVSEATLWTAWTHCGTMKALKDSHMMCVDAGMFARAMRKVPLPHTKEYAGKFVAYLNSESVLTDLGPERFQMRSMALEIFTQEDQDFVAPAEWGTHRRRSLGSLNAADTVMGMLSGRRNSLTSSTSGRRTSLSSFQNVLPQRRPSVGDTCRSPSEDGDSSGNISPKTPNSGHVSGFSLGHIDGRPEEQ